MTVGSIGRMDVVITPGLKVDTINRIQPDFACFNERPARLNHPKIFIFIKAPSLGRKDESRFTGVAVDFEFHFLV
jgi:hypothetical protein